MMIACRPRFLALALALGVAAAGRLASAAESLRLDLQHGGNRDTESFSLDRIVEEPFPCGNPQKPVDETNLGNYLVKVWDARTNRLLYTRRLSDLWNEWRTTDEPGARSRTIPTSVRIPKPAGPVQVEIDGRNRDNSFHDIFRTTVDPGSLEVSRERRRGDLVVRDVMVNGAPEDHVDILFVS